MAVSELVPGFSSPGSSPARRHCVVFLGKTLTLTVPLSTLGRVFRKPVNANPGLKVDWGNNFSCIKVLSIASVLGSLRLLMPKTEGQKI